MHSGLFAEPAHAMISSAGVAPDTPLDTAYYVKNNPYQKPTRTNEQLKMILGKSAPPRCPAPAAECACAWQLASSPSVCSSCGPTA